MLDVIVIGGGPAGMMAAIAAMQNGRQVLLLEKNEKLGKKLLITGKGRCNLTNECEIDDFFEQIPVNPRFLYSAFSAFSNRDLVEMLNHAGLATKVERGGRVFPQSDRASDVLYTLEKCLSGVKIRYHAAVKQILIENGRVTGVKLFDGACIEAKTVIVATGGASYTATGSTGDGYRFAEQAGHNIVPLKASLAPIETIETWPREVQGLALKNIALTLQQENGKKLYTDFGEMLFTHFGVSGPVVLSASAHVKGNCCLSIDLKPALGEEVLNKRILRDFEQNSNRDFINSLDKLFPKKLIPVMVQLSGIEPHKKVNQVDRKERKKFCEIIKNLKLTVKNLRPIEEAIITSGGVQVKQISPKTMESKLVSGLRFCGEVLDVDGYTGGFNLQIAFSTGYLAGSTI